MRQTQTPRYSAYDADLLVWARALSVSPTRARALCVYPSVPPSLPLSAHTVASSRWGVLVASGSNPGVLSVQCAAIVDRQR